MSSMTPAEPNPPDPQPTPTVGALRLHWPQFWAAVGWTGLLGIVVVCLLPLPAGSLDVPGSDKFLHLFAWFLLMFGHTQLGLGQSALLWRAGLFVAVGVLIEYAQQATGYRSADARDVVANVLGVVFGLVIGTSAPHWLLRLETRLRGLRRRRAAANPARTEARSLSRDCPAPGAGPDARPGPGSD